MKVLHQTVVTPDQIDHLGHMNVRFYGVAARHGARALLGALGAEPASPTELVGRDLYVRHHREQLEGASLEVRGGVLDVTEGRIRLYEELVNPATNEVAATFVLGYDRIGIDGERLALPAGVVEAAGRARVTMPEHGRPRSISMDEDPTTDAPPLAVLQERGLALRQVRVVDESAEPDEDGVVPPTSIPELIWGGEPVAGAEFRPLEPLPGGGSMGFATMETRSTWARAARLGDRVQSFHAELDIQAKTMLTRHWLYDVDRAELVAVFSVVNVAFDTTARRAIVIPDSVRERLGRRYHADLTPTADRA